MKDKILLGVLLAIVVVGTVVGIFDFLVWAQPTPEAESIAIGLFLGAFFTAFTPVIGFVWKYLFNGLFLHFPILNVFVILRALVSFIAWVVIAGLIIDFSIPYGAKGIIISALVVAAHVAYRIYRIKNPDVVVNGEEV